MKSTFVAAVNSLLQVSAMALGLVALGLGNEVLLRDTEVTLGVNWIYLPAGLRLCYVLVLPVQGTVAIFLASLALASRDPSLTPALVALNALATAAAPPLARAVALHHFKLDPNLANLTTSMLIKLALLFGLFSTTLHQAFYAFIGREPAFLAMWIGDVLGALLCLYGLRGLAMVVRRGT